MFRIGVCSRGLKMTDLTLVALALILLGQVFISVGGLRDDSAGEELTPN